jgi:hypothetical protein
MRTRCLLRGAEFLSVSLLISVLVVGQSITTGEVSGVVTDATDAVVPNVVVGLKSIEKGFTQTTTTSALGIYRFPLLAPGGYVVSATVTGFASTSRNVTVAVGQIASADIKLSTGMVSTKMEVTSETPLLDNQNADESTTFNSKQVADIPNPGSDLTYLAQTAPGAVMNTQGGFGNFSANGLPSTSNLFTLDGMYDNDPYFNLSNAGATNLVLGSNEIEEVTVVNNGYSGQYGGFAGAYVNYISKSGSNHFHGNAVYGWNGRAMNANNWFNNDVPPGTPVTPRPFVNANQYAASIGGPIKRNKAFFYFDYEGLRVVLPTSRLTLIPSPQFEVATLANLASTNRTASIPFYTQMFNLWSGAPGADRAVPGNPQTGDPTGCNRFTGPGGLGTTAPCALSFRSVAGNFTHEYLLGGRFDLNIGQNDSLFFRMREDKGFQASYTDPINPVFNGQSIQPIYQGQVSENHVFSARAVNQLVFSGLYASFVTQPKDLSAALATFPTTVALGDGTFNNVGGIDAFLPSGHNFTVYQVLDDFSLAAGSSHNLKFGLGFERHDISVHDYGVFTSGFELPFTLADFFAGGNGPSGDSLSQTFPSSRVRPFAFYGLGFYAQDDWLVRRNLHLTLALRVDHNSNPVCQQNCLARFAVPFSQLNHDANIPYNQAIQTRLHQAFPSFTNVAWQPRLGFSWTPSGLKNTVLRGGIGLFMDTLPGFLASGLSFNPPLVNFFVVGPDNLSPAEPSNLFKDAAYSNAAFLSGFSGGGTLASIKAADPSFVPPAVTTAVGIKAPQFQKWNLEIEHGFGLNTTITLNYVGNHGIFIPVSYNGINAFCPPPNPTGNPACLAGFTGLPESAPDPRFSTVTELRSGAVSNYNGLVTSFRHRFQKGFLVQANYAWSHALDELSNGGNLNFNNGTAYSLQSPEDSSNLRKYNYGNADYDTRHYFSANYVWELPYRFGSAVLLKGWQVSGTIFTRSGLPYTVIDSGTTNLLTGFGYGGTVFANVLGTSFPRCSSPKHPCFAQSQFSSPITQNPATYGSQRRNQFYGPGYFNTDFKIIKNTAIPGWERGQLGLGVQFFNLFNHPNFDQPNRDINDPSLFGQITRTVNTPTSILGSLLGGDASPRLIQLTARINF